MLFVGHALSKSGSDHGHFDRLIIKRPALIYDCSEDDLGLSVDLTGDRISGIMNLVEAHREPPCKVHQ
jgi:hypothetical protein